jgi:hypothetical protein
MKGIEPPTPSLPWKCSTPELHWLINAKPALIRQSQLTPLHQKDLIFQNTS